LGDDGIRLLPFVWDKREKSNYCHFCITNGLRRTL
jgi:hypothetical protein